MVSTFGWLDTDGAARQQMLEIVDLFREQGTLDDLGIGQVRDTLADLMFPGTSTLHTRLRYVLFIPWLLSRAATKRTSTEMVTELRNVEFRLVDSLKRGDAGVGIIGAAAGRELKRLPSSVYWAAIGAWGIRTRNFSPEAFFTQAHHLGALASHAPMSDDPESRATVIDTGLDPRLPTPPKELLKESTFALTASETDYLTDRITASTAGSMLAWLIYNPPQHTPVDEVGAPWDLEHLHLAPEPIQRVVDHAFRFQVAVHGARLSYNLLLARASDRPELVTDYEERIASWRAEVKEKKICEDWDTDAFWAILNDHNPITWRTQQFISTWLRHVQRGTDPVTDSSVKALIIARERQLKGPRARFNNPAALDRWSGAVGLARLDYRWSYVRTLLADLEAGRSA